MNAILINILLFVHLAYHKLISSINKVIFKKNKFLNLDLISSSDYVNLFLYCYLPETLDETACNNLGNNVYINTGLNYDGTAPFLNYYDVYRYCALGITNGTSNNRKINKKDLSYIEKIK